MYKYLLFLYFFFGINGILLANNVQVNNVEVIRIDRSNKIIYIQFDLSGENAWRIRDGADNWDADWVFIKYRSGTGDWRHATLSTNRSIFIYPAGVTIDPATDGKGVFIYSSNADAGLISSYNYQKIVLAWEYGTDGFDENTNDLEVKVFAIEMVYIPQGDFYVGDGSSSNTLQNTANSPAKISSTGVEVSCPVNDTDDDIIEAGIWIDGDDGIDTDGDLTIDNTSFPTGYKAFYCMKYEISQQQYVDFLNNLTATEANACWEENNSTRNNVTAPSNHPNITTTSPYVAMNWLDWYDLTAFLDWAALRPMTELEFEKAARGTNAPVAGEYAWGTKNIANYQYTLDNVNTANETVTNANSVGNANWDNTVPSSSLKGPMRCGIFAVNNTSNSREFAGASFYGVMSLSGNLWELTVTIGNLDGRNFAGSHGDGKLVNAAADNSDWPHSGKDDTLGSGFRGGAYRYPSSRLATSNRSIAAHGYYKRDNDQGGRGVRTAN